MTRALASSSWLNAWRTYRFALASLMLLLGMPLIIGPVDAQVSTQSLSATNAQIIINANQSLSSLTNVSQGINAAVWDKNLLDSASLNAVKNAQIKVMRYPGGSTSDVYHWQSNTVTGGQVSPGNNFDAFMNGIQSIGAQPVITVNYGSGTPQEAANWVQYANKGGPAYHGPLPTYADGSSTGHSYAIKYWEVGNEIYGNGTYGATWEIDHHTHTPATYAHNIVAYSQAMKAADSTIKVGAVLTAPDNWPDGITNSASPQSWNKTVLSTACSSIDFVIAHWYPQNSGNESNAGLLGDSSQIAGMVSTLHSEINQYCGSRASAIQILVTETNSVSSNPGKQTVSTVNALFLADNYMTWLENGVTNVDWWDLHNNAVAGNVSSSLYGNTQYGEYGVLANATCTSHTCEPSANTPLPAYYALLMLSKLGRPGDRIVSSLSNQSLVAVHAVKQANGDLAVMLINKDPDNIHTVSLALNGYIPTTRATVYTYGEHSSALTSTQETLQSPVMQQLAPYSLTTVVMHPESRSIPTAAGTLISGTKPAPASSSTCNVRYSTNQWPDGFTANLTITNTGTTALKNWTLTFTFPGNQRIIQGWNGIFTQQGSHVTITHTSYNSSLLPGSSVNPGFNGSWSGSNASPMSFMLNGATCSVS